MMLSKQLWTHPLSLKWAEWAGVPNNNSGHTGMPLTHLLQLFRHSVACPASDGCLKPRRDAISVPLSKRTWSGKATFPVWNDFLVLRDAASSSELCLTIGGTRSLCRPLGREELSGLVKRPLGKLGGQVLAVSLVRGVLGQQHIHLRAVVVCQKAVLKCTTEILVAGNTWSHWNSMRHTFTAIDWHSYKQRGEVH